MDSKKVWAEIKKQFPGKNNRALRDRMFNLAQKTGQVDGLRNTVAFTATGLAGLKKVEEVIHAG